MRNSQHEIQDLNTHTRTKLNDEEQGPTQKQGVTTYYEEGSADAASHKYIHRSTRGKDF